MAGVGDVARAGGVKHDDAKKTFEGLVKLMMENEKVTIAGLGTFRLRTRNARKARNPQTGDEVQVPAKAIPDLDFNRTFKAEVAEKWSKKLLGGKAGKSDKKSNEKSDKKSDKNDKKDKKKNKK